jgi:hypothetical protein
MSKKTKQQPISVKTAETIVILIGF